MRFDKLRDLSGIASQVSTGVWVTQWVYDKPYALTIWAAAIPSILLYFIFDIAHVKSEG